MIIPKDMPVVSVIVPVYNAGMTLEKCLDSIISQTFSDFELLIVDDGSHDNSADLCDKYVLLDSRIKVWHKPNGGVCSTRNFGLDRAAGKYVCFVDSDDYVADNWLADLVKGVEQYPDYLVLSNVKMIEPNRQYLRYPNQSGIFDIEDIWRLGDWGYSVNKIYRKDIIDKMNLRYDEKLRVYEDELFIARYCAEINQAYIIPSVGYYYVLSNQFENKYNADLNFDYMMYQYCEVRKYNKRCSDYLVDRLIMIAFRHILDHKGSFNGIVSSIRLNVGKEIRSVQGGRKVLMKKLNNSSALWVWKVVFGFYVTFKLI